MKHASLIDANIPQWNDLGAGHSLFVHLKFMHCLKLMEKSEFVAGVTSSTTTNQHRLYFMLQI